MKCSLCKGDCRKRELAFVLDKTKPGNHRLAMKQVCITCKSKGVTVIEAGTTAATRCACGRAASIARCTVCERDKERKPDALQKAIAKKLNGFAKLEAAQGNEHEQHIYERAADLVLHFDPAQVVR